MPRELVDLLLVLFLISVTSTTRCADAAKPSRRRSVKASSPSYDRLISTFSPEGRLEQVEYSAQAATRTVLATVDRQRNKIIVVAAAGSLLQPVFNDYSDDSSCRFNAWMIGTGIAGDVLWWRNVLRKLVLKFIIEKDDVTTPIDSLARKAETFCHEITFVAGARPFAVAFFLLGFLNEIPEIAKVTGWNGATTRLDFACLGPHQDALHTFVNRRRMTDSTQQAVDTLLDAAKHVLGMQTKLDVWILSANGETRHYMNVQDRASRRRLQECLVHQENNTNESDRAQIDDTQGL